MNLEREIIAIADVQGKVTSADVASRFSISRQYAFTEIKKLVEKGKLIKIGSTRSAFYIPAGGTIIAQQKLSLKLNNRKLEEYEILKRIRDRFLPIKLARENIQSIFDYAFSEMMNNAIEHSKSKRIEVEVSVDERFLQFKIRDFGIGVFLNVMKQRGLKNELEAMQDILKGKTTTQPLAHSGEGIFFTSKSADLFYINSYEWSMQVNNLQSDIFFEPLKKSLRGSEIVFLIRLDSTKHLSDVFEKFQLDQNSKAFDATEIQVRLFTYGTIHVSRSQARRILDGLEKFKKVTFDFEKVSTIGQAFADEIFRVFHNKHPEIELVTKNANEAVQSWIAHIGK